MKICVFAAALTVVVSMGFARQTIELNNWKFATGDNLEWAQPGFNDVAWQTLIPGAAWQAPNYDDFSGYAWLRVKFNLPSAFKSGATVDSLLISVGLIYDGEQTFLNGRLLALNARQVSAPGGTTLADIAKPCDDCCGDRNYVLKTNDPRLLWDQENTLAIRVFCYNGRCGMYSLPVNIRMKTIADYLGVDLGHESLEQNPAGTFSKTITLENRILAIPVKGTLRMEIKNASTQKELASKAFPVNLQGKENYTLSLKNNDARWVATCTFTEATTGQKLVYSQQPECSGGWKKYDKSPVLGGLIGTMFDVSVMRNDAGMYRMYCSWREQKSIAISESKDGLRWGMPIICLPFNNVSGWENDVNRPVVIQKDGVYHLWYTGQTGAATAGGHSWIGYATSTDGKNWERKSDKPIISAELPWEHVAVMSPHVIWDEQEHIFKMWYCGGEQIEPNAIGYATSKDGEHWEKYKGNPIFSCDKNNYWEHDRTGGCMVIKRANDYLMFYIGYVHMGYAQIGMARSKDGITNWERYSQNPIIKPGTGWDVFSCYKPYAMPDPENNRWLLWYNGSGPNGRGGGLEQIGVVVHEGMDLGF